VVRGRRPEASGKPGLKRKRSAIDLVNMESLKPLASVSAAFDVPVAEGVCQWGALLTVHLPEGTIRHPAVLDRVQEELGRICAIDTASEGVRVSYGVRGASFGSATEDARAVARHLMEMLSLPPEAITEHVLVPRLGPGEDGRTSQALSLVPDPA